MKYLNLLDNKVFISLANTANGDVNSATRFYYSQKRLGDYCQGWGRLVQISKMLERYFQILNL
ncbi:hypothetical protein ABIC56_004198 [Acinetobacter bereziniae]|nr:hypothetical protein [Acinetobacter bereziniae]